MQFVQQYAQELSDETYGTYNFNWGYYLNSLKLYCETGTGTRLSHPPVSSSVGGGSRDLRVRSQPAAASSRRSRREIAVSSGVRHSVSTKILTEPPAVRMYSTFPLAIQL